MTIRNQETEEDKFVEENWDSITRCFECQANELQAVFSLRRRPLIGFWSSLGLNSLPKQNGLEIDGNGSRKKSLKFHSGVQEK